MCGEELEAELDVKWPICSATPQGFAPPTGSLVRMHLLEHANPVEQDLASHEGFPENQQPKRSFVVTDDTSEKSMFNLGKTPTLIECKPVPKPVSFCSTGHGVTLTGPTRFSTEAFRNWANMGKPFLCGSVA